MSNNNNNYNEQNVAISYYIEEIENQEKEGINVEEHLFKCCCMFSNVVTIILILLIQNHIFRNRFH